MSNGRHTVLARDPRPGVNVRAREGTGHPSTHVDSRARLPGDDGYNEARLAWRRTVDPYPALIVEAATVEDVRAAIRMAREHALPLAVQSTGHGTVVPSDGGLLLKTTRMDGVEIDPERRTARVSAGTLWNEVIAAAAPFGLAPLSGSSPWVGVAGYTLGGGAGLLSRKHGYAADAVISADVVTASGEILSASADENPDLFWALRGGGGNFGIVTSLEFRLFPVSQVYAGMSFFDIARAPEALARYREAALEEPDELSTALVLTRMPDAEEVPEPIRGKQVLILRALYLGDADEAERTLAPLREVLGEPLVEGIRPTTFAELNAAPPPPRQGLRDTFAWLREIPDAVIETIVGVAEGGAGTPLTAIEVRHWGGAMARAGQGAGPVGHRDVPFSIMAAWTFDGSRVPEEIDASVEAFAAALRPYSTGGSFLNFLSDPTDVESAYRAEDYRRLATLKAVYDPDNVFRLNHNIPPSPRAAGEHPFGRSQAAGRGEGGRP